MHVMVGNTILYECDKSKAGSYTVKSLAQVSMHVPTARLYSCQVHIYSLWFQPHTSPNPFSVSKPGVCFLLFIFLRILGLHKIYHSLTGHSRVYWNMSTLNSIVENDR